MVCKEDVITWFKEAAAYRRIDVMCSLLNMCIPFELRFLGTCIEEQGKHDYQELRGAAITANDIEKLAKELSSSKGVLETCTRHRLTIYLSLLQSHNYNCANWMYYTLLRNESLDLLMGNGNFLKDMNVHTELLLLFTLALNHPAFTFEQRTYFGEVLSRLSEPEIPVQPPQNPPPCPPGLGYFKPPLPVHHMPIVISKGHTELQGPPGIPMQPVHGDFMTPPGMWPARTHFINTSCPPPEIPNFPPPVSPLVSQQSSPSHSRSVSPSRLFSGRPPHTPAMPHMDRLPPPVKEAMVITNAAYNTDLKTVPIEEVCHGDIEKTPWMDQIILPPNMKMPNGLLPVAANKCQPVYLAGELQALTLDGEATLQCSSSSSSSNSSDCQSPPDTPTDTAVVTPHGPGRGIDLKMKMNGSNLSPGLGVPGAPSPADMNPTTLYNNCTVPYTNQYPLPPAFHNRSLFYSQAYHRPQFPPYQTNSEILYPFPIQYLPVPYSSGAIPQSKVTCYNCGLSGHVGTECKELTIEEITQKRGYQLDYKSPPPDSSMDKQQ